MGLERLQRSRLLRANTNLNDKGGEILAAGMSFQALFAVFAALWVSFGCFGFYLRANPEVLDALVDNLQTLVPGLFGETGAVAVQELLDSPALDWSSAIAMGSLFLLVLTWFHSTRTAIRLINDLHPKPVGVNGLLMKLRDVGFALGFGVLILLTTLLSIGVTVVVSRFADAGVLPKDSWVFSWFGWFVALVVMCAVNWFILFAIQKWLAQLELPARRIWCGTFPGAVGLVVLTLLSSVLVGDTSKNPLLAPFAAIIGLLLWFNLVCRVLLFTASWIAAGADPECGLPSALRVRDAAAKELVAAVSRAGIAYDGAHTGSIEISSLEPAARLRR